MWKNGRGKSQFLSLGRESKQIQCYRQVNFSSVPLKRNICGKEKTKTQTKVINSQNKLFLGKWYQSGSIFVCYGINPSPLWLEEKQWDIDLNSEVHISRLVKLSLDASSVRWVLVCSVGVFGGRCQCLFNWKVKYWVRIGRSQSWVRCYLIFSVVIWMMK